MGAVGRRTASDDDRTIRRSRVALEWGGGGKKRTEALSALRGYHPAERVERFFRVDLRYRLFGLCFK